MNEPLVDENLALGSGVIVAVVFYDPVRDLLVGDSLHGIAGGFGAGPFVRKQSRPALLTG